MQADPEVASEVAGGDIYEFAKLDRDLEERSIERRAHRQRATLQGGQHQHGALPPGPHCASLSCVQVVQPLCTAGKLTVVKGSADPFPLPPSPSP